MELVYPIMIRILPTLAPALLATMLSGCADLQWTKPGADATAVSRDLDACRAVALNAAAAPVAPAGSTESVTDHGRPRAMQPSAGSNERFVAEQETIRRCMASRGYALRQEP